MRKFLIFLCVCVVCFFNVSPSYYIYAESLNLDKTTIEKDLLENINVKLEDFDFSGLDSYLQEINNASNLIGNTSFLDLVKGVVSGEYFTSYSSLFDLIKSMLVSSFKNVIPVLFLIIGVAVLCNILNSLKPTSVGTGVSDVIHFVSFSIVVLIVVSNFNNVISLTKNVLESMSEQMEIIFPILLTLLTSVGGVASVSIYKPVVVLLTQGVSLVFNKFLFPMFILAFVFLVLGNLSKNIKLNKFTSLLSSLFKWCLGFVFTIFATIITLQGISAGKFDGVSVKATKFAVKSYIPLIGGYISDGFDLIMCASILIKNAVGVVGVLLILFSIISPIIQILILKFGLQLVSAILEVSGDSQICNFAAGCSKVLVYPIVLICAVAFMYVLSVGLIMMTANVF